MATPQTLNTTRDVHNPSTQDARGGGNIAGGASIHEGNTKLLPWLLLCSMLGGIALGMSIGAVFIASHAEDRMRTENDRQYRFLQELRVRVEDAEMAAKEVNPNFKPARQPKEH
jgi:hypothetical protein